MVYAEKYTTKWHDTDAARRVTISKMLVFMQETSNHHMANCGPTLDTLRDEHGLAFLLSKIRMSVYRPLYAFEEIEVQTWTYAAHGFSFPRCFRILRGDEVIAEADTVWALLDIKNNVLVKGTDCDLYGFEDEEPLELDVPLRFKLPKGLELTPLGERRIVWSDLDYNMHMNNTKYPDMLCDFLPTEDIGKINGVFLSYVNEAAFGDSLVLKSAFSDGVRYFRTVNSEGKICLEAELLLEENKGSEI